MNPEAVALSELETLIGSTLTLTGIYRQSSLARTNWIRMIGAGTLVTPFVVLETGPSEPADFGLDNLCYWWRAGMTLVVSTADSGATTDVASYVQAQLAALRSAVLLYSGTGFQCAGEEPDIDVTARNSANQALLGLQASKFAGEMRVRLLIGESVNS